jgi:hypothetical protein
MVFVYDAQLAEFDLSKLTHTPDEQYCAILRRSHWFAIPGGFGIPTIFLSQMACFSFLFQSGSF